MPSAADMAAIAGGQAAPAAAPILTPAGTPFNPAEWTPSPGVNPQTNLEDPSLPTYGFENKKTGEWMQSLPAAAGPNQGSSQTADPDSFGTKAAIAQGVLSGEIKAPEKAA